MGDSADLITAVELSLFPSLGVGGAFQRSSCISSGLQYTVSEVSTFFHIKPCSDRAKIPAAAA